MKAFIVAKISKKNQVVYWSFENYFDAKKMKDLAEANWKKWVVIHVFQHNIWTKK